MKRVTLVSIVLTMVFLAWSCASSSGGGGTLKTTLWPKDISETITADGEGLIPKDAESDDQGRLMAIRAAKMDAYRNLTEKILGIRLTNGTTVRNFIMGDDTIKGNVCGYINNAEIDGTPIKENNSYKVTLKINLGKNFTQILFAKGK